MNKKPVTLKEGKRTWVSFPEVLPGGKFRGYETRYDESQNRGAFVIGQNVKFTDGHTPTVRDGYEIQETEAADATPVNLAAMFRAFFSRIGVSLMCAPASTERAEP